MLRAEENIAKSRGDGKGGGRQGWGEYMEKFYRFGDENM